MSVVMSVVAACLLTISGTALAQANAPVPASESAVPRKARAALTAPVVAPTGGTTAPQARKAVSHPGKQGEGQTEDDLYVGAHLRKQPAPGGPATGSGGAGQPRAAPATPGAAARSAPGAPPSLAAPATVRPLGGGFTATYGVAGAEIAVPPRCDLACRRSMVDRLRRGGYQARLSDQGGTVQIQGGPPPGSRAAPGPSSRGWCEDDCRAHLEDLLAPVVRGSR